MIAFRKDAKAQRKAPNNQQEKSLRLCAVQGCTNAAGAGAAAFAVKTSYYSRVP